MTPLVLTVPSNWPGAVSSFLRNYHVNTIKEYSVKTWQTHFEIQVQKTHKPPSPGAEPTVTMVIYEYRDRAVWFNDQVVFRLKKTTP